MELGAIKRGKLAAAAAMVAMAAIGEGAQGLRLHYDGPARWMEEALVMGNGKMGATVYGQPDRERLSLNDITLWTGMPEGREERGEGREEILAQVRGLLDEDRFTEANEAHKGLQGHYSENYSPLGTMFITLKGVEADSVADYRRGLDLQTATVVSQFTLPDGQRVEKTYFASSPEKVMVLRLRNLEGGALPEVTVSMESLLPHEVQWSDRCETLWMEGKAAAHSLPVYLGGVADSAKHIYTDEGGIRFRAGVKALLPKGGRASGTPGGVLRIAAAPEVVLLYTSETSFDGADKNPVTEGKDYRAITSRNLERASMMSFDELQSRQREDYGRLFSRVSLEVGQTPDSVAALPTDVQLRRYTALGEKNPDLEELYFQFGRYLLISCSRTPGVPANLQGLWNEQLLPPWSSNYTSNINLEENYWGAETTNLSELHQPLMDFIAALQVNGERTANDYYGVREGWCLGQNTDLWAMTNPVGLTQGNPVWANWTMGGAWLSTHVWDHYLFTLDSDFLERYYPALKGAAEFCLGWLVEKDGYLMTSPGTSPENDFLTPGERRRCATTYGATSDLAMTRQCLIDAVAAARELGRDEEFVAEAEKALARLAPYKVGSKGSLQEWWVDFEEAEPTHRHQSHLFGLYPGNHLSPEATPELARAAHKTLELRGPESTGWSTGWRVNLYARLNDADMAYATYRRLLKYISPDGYRGEDAVRGGGTYPNLLDAHSPFQIDGNFGGSAGVAEMLVQSSPRGEITLLPALPAEWADGEVKGLRARGGFQIDSLKWKDSKPTAVAISSEHGGTATLKFGHERRTVELAPGGSAEVNF